MDPQKVQPVNNPKPQPQPVITDSQAQEILKMNALGTDKNKRSKGFLIFIIAVVVVTLAVGIFLESIQKKPVAQTNSSSSNPSSQANPLNSGSVDAQSKYCQNPVNANLYC